MPAKFPHLLDRRRWFAAGMQLPGGQIGFCDGKNVIAGSKGPDPLVDLAHCIGRNEMLL